MTRHPTQPSEKDEQGVLRFKANAIVRFLLDAGPYDMNTLAMMPFTDEDRRQFAQLIGYSVSGYGDLSYAEDDAPIDAIELVRDNAQIEVLRGTAIGMRNAAYVVRKDGGSEERAKAFEDAAFIVDSMAERLGK
jgi:hypothetical protein